MGAKKRTTLGILIAAALIGATAFFVFADDRAPDASAPTPTAVAAEAPAKDKPAEPKTWDPPVLGSMPAGTVRHVGGVKIAAPQTYEVRLKVSGWLERDNGILCVEIGDGRLLGAIDARTGEERARPSAGEPDHSSALRGLKVLTGTTPGVRGALRPECTARLILLPVGDGATLFVDSVVE